MSTTQATTPETKEDGTTENGQDKTNEPHKPGMESEPTEQPSLSQLIKNKTLVDQEDGKPEPTRQTGCSQHETVYCMTGDFDRSGYCQACTCTQRN